MRPRAMARWRFVRWIRNLLAASDVERLRIDTYLYHVLHRIVKRNSAGRAVLRESRLRSQTL